MSYDIEIDKSVEDKFIDWKLPDWILDGLESLLADELAVRPTSVL